MELIGGFLLWLADIAGIKWVTKKRGKLGILVRVAVYLIVGFIAVVLFFTLKSI
jgi:hypothetical protein